MTAREDAIDEALTRWAIRLDLPVTVHQLTAAVLEVEAAIRRREPRGPRPVVGLSPKPQTGPDDARAIARRIEAGLAGPAAVP
ncbi:hypothetical protein [Kitasatospora acidiphila]|uniref:hypothetical protein n=1 Tax=Kitasatospora acidiphila TaxID=2567942 RepID=UPI0015F108A9|nr:hypothetical protein [Kitasatospora acidiphila]